MKIKREKTGTERAAELVYQLKVYPLFGQIDTLHQQFLMRVVSITQRGGVQIHDNLYVQRTLFTRFPSHRSVEKGTEDLPCELG